MAEVQISRTNNAVPIAAVTVGSSAAVQLAPSSTRRPGLVLINESATDVRIGGLSSLTAAEGFLLPGVKGAALSLDNFDGEIWAITASGSATVSGLELLP